MSRTMTYQYVAILVLTGTLVWSGSAWAQTFSSGSTGALGAFNPTTSTTVVLPPDGILNYTTINVPSGVTVTFTPNAANTPVTMVATGDVTIAGMLDVRGKGPEAPPFTTPARGGPGGFPGGICGPVAGSGPGGGNPSTSTNPNDRNATYGAASSFVSLIPLFGGSGGAGCVSSDSSTFPGGGGGGGAIVLASSTKITVTGSILANGGGPGFISGGGTILGGNGSGGAIRLVAPQVTGSGTVQAGGAGPAGSGRIRLESLTPHTITGSISPGPSVSTAPGPVTAASTPALVNAPKLTFTSIGGVAGPVTPTGSYATADISLPSGTTNPVPVVLTANNLPIGTVFTLKVIPQVSAISAVTMPATTGTFETATTTVNVSLPPGEVSLLLAFANLTLPQLASLLPLIDGEPVDQIMVAATAGGASTLTLITRSGTERRAEQLPPEDQAKLALAWEAFGR